jgi:L-histidine Nalpha-methyltransferase
MSREHPGLRVEPFVGDFERHLGAIPAGGPRMVAFFGSTVTTSSAMAHFLSG